ncbi:MAG TPA: flagellar hook-associated protein FlgL, partial [Burkholderiaceae bacterium]|nr:flagellar hook-associated protein FlgL [Burkholderiaceae bacterium]
MLRVSTHSLYRVGEQSVVARQRELLETQVQLSHGKRIASPADDPLGAADATAVRSSLAQFSQFKQNQDHARYVLNLQESSLRGVVDSIHDIQEKLVAAGNGSYTNNERIIVAQELEGILGRMVGLANSGDGVGGYLFAGARESTVPFTQSGTAVSFNGDSILQTLEVSKDRFQQIKFSGDAIFQKIRPGNGSFTTAATATNTGSGVIDVGSVSDPSALTGSAYTVTFAVAAGTTTYQMVRASDSAVVASGTYTDPLTLNVDGVRVNISGIPADTDTFTVTPSSFQSIFDTVADAISVLRTPANSAAGNALLTTNLGGLMASMDRALDLGRIVAVMRKRVMR